MDHKIMGNTHNGTLLSNKVEQNYVILGKWMDLENIMLSEISQSQKVEGHVFSHMWELRSNLDKRGTSDNGG